MGLVRAVQNNRSTSCLTNTTSACKPALDFGSGRNGQPRSQPTDSTHAKYERLVTSATQLREGPTMTSTATWLSRSPEVLVVLTEVQ